VRHLISVLLVTSLGCGAGAGIGDSCSLDEPCGSGGVCDLSDPEGAVCIEAEGDLDGDGLSNAEDFCNHEPGGQFDEDRDGFGDECDRCPIAAPPSSPDPDGDDVDSPCDPDPSSAGDQIVVFEGFNSGALPPGFLAGDGWTFLQGEVVVDADAQIETTLTAMLPLVSQQVVVFGQYRIDGIDIQATQNLAGVVAIDERPAGGSQIKCSGSRTGDADRLLLVTDNGSSTANFADLFDSASLYRLTLKIDRANAACAMIADEENGAAQAPTLGEAMNRAGLFARGVSARFQHLLVIQRGSDGGS
jgi:hypothetical protein